MNTQSPCTMLIKNVYAITVLTDDLPFDPSFIFGSRQNSIRTQCNKSETVYALTIGKPIDLTPPIPKR